MPEQIILEEKTSNVQSNAVDSVALNLRGRDGRCLEVSHLIILGIIGILVVGYNLSRSIKSMRNLHLEK
ncbi:hypothetical protein C2G38_2214272 [Gigaspora rosea]|uniref:Uncharacterized protein n=1 Tax=Gigaspora rosea TaxID=44941 RepID=A0A397UEI3_9GLOM|nr:hypothetical protein C2G38_2214272 [Gigaspora rosea]